MSATTVWISPSATIFACLCERCLDDARTNGVLFAEALRVASVRGTVASEAETAVVRCNAGHELVLRRGARPAALRRDDRQLQIA